MLERKIKPREIKEWIYLTINTSIQFKYKFQKHLLLWISTTNWIARTAAVAKTLLIIILTVRNSSNWICFNRTWWWWKLSLQMIQDSTIRHISKSIPLFLHHRNQAENRKRLLNSIKWTNFQQVIITTQ